MAKVNPDGDPRYEWKDLSFITEPKQGFEVYKDKYWVSRDGKILFFNLLGTLLPQCNRDKGVIESVYGLDALFVPLAFVDTRSWK